MEEEDPTVWEGVTHFHDNQEGYHRAKTALFVLHLSADHEITRVAFLVEIENMPHHLNVQLMYYEKFLSINDLKMTRQGIVELKYPATSETSLVCHEYL